MSKRNREKEYAFDLLIRKGASADIHLIVSCPSSHLTDRIARYFSHYVGLSPYDFGLSVKKIGDSPLLFLDGFATEELVGYGELLFTSTQNSEPVHAQGCSVSREEAVAIVDYLKPQGPPDERGQRGVLVVRADEAETY